MIEAIEAPQGVLAFRAVGEIHSEDYEQVLQPALEAASEAGDEIRMVYVLGPEFEGYSAGAAWEDAKLGLGHLKGWHRVAVVTSHEWVGHAVKAFGWMLPGKVRVFAADGLEGALAWAAED